MPNCKAILVGGSTNLKNSSQIGSLPQIKTLETTTYILYNPHFATSSDTVTSANICFSRVFLNKKQPAATHWS